ncbi:2-oxoglutarate and iron-dependent oxygenase domain-containing protein 1 [Cricetulus griseus]|uniref:2-oxoglutarate and iron-dependent oxygenase domain-containing protein 1 n=1 Tax=Cricetulus griseus TaxID=10029 RepID=G3HIJ5_CRIGR|nr:2-oxoglutarate and iron-dependent oxygenase domain-containing protein 1 [Cricetulus griseus]
MNGKRPADPGPARPVKKGKKQVAAEFSDAVTEETVRKQVAEAWSCRTPFSHGNGVLKLMFEDFRDWLSKVSSIDLEPTIDMSCAKYEFTDALLCHDDELEGRRIAFILYLVPSWDRNLGGTLDLYDTDEHFQPKQIVKSLLPSWNKLVFFEVSPVSFHQPEKFAKVCDALEKGDVEWSSCGPPNRRFYERAEESNLPDVLKECMGLFRSEALFLLLSNFTGLKLHFLAPSEDELEDKGDGEAACAADGTEEGTSQSPSEPENKQAAVGSHSQESGEQADPEPQEDEAKKESGIPTCQGELRHWKTGHYTLVHDNSKTEFALDLFLYCGCEGWEPEYGGFTSYIAKGEDEELLIVNPENNSLALVYRDRETMKFVKHINHRSLEQKKTFPNRSGFWDFAFVYYE